MSRNRLYPTTIGPGWIPYVMEPPHIRPIGTTLSDQTFPLDADASEFFGFAPTDADPMTPPAGTTDTEAP